MLTSVQTILEVGVQAWMEGTQISLMVNTFGSHQCLDRRLPKNPTYTIWSLNGRRRQDIKRQ